MPDGLANSLGNTFRPELPWQVVDDGIAVDDLGIASCLHGDQPAGVAQRRFAASVRACRHNGIGIAGYVGESAQPTVGQRSIASSPSLVTAITGC